ncbi:MAG TPA: hypothetical protein VKC56_00640 [Gallionellaceae bacterium]|nr:hypothetical protein [Gallionellaceae bacterium]
MSETLDSIIAFVSAEKEHVRDMETCFLYFAALAETRIQGRESDLFIALPRDLPRGCDDHTAQRLYQVITEFIDSCPNHPSVRPAFRILLNLGASEELERYLLDKLHLYSHWGDALIVGQLCLVLQDLGVATLLDENGERVTSWSANEVEQNLGYARRLLERKRTHATLEDAGVSNQCVLVCELKDYHGKGSICWNVYKGAEDEIGTAVAERLRQAHISRIEDFFGVSQTILCEGGQYAEDPLLVRPHGAVFSFTPRKRVMEEAHDMARAARSAGYELLVVTPQKHGKFGKAWVLRAVLRHAGEAAYTYYEDTNTVIDEIKSLPEGARLTAIHVEAPGFEEFKSQLSDRVISQKRYLEEVLQPREE